MHTNSNKTKKTKPIYSIQVLFGGDNRTCKEFKAQQNNECAGPHMNNANSRHTESALFFARDYFGIRFYLR